MEQGQIAHGSAMRHWSLSVIFTYFVVFVFHPAFVLTLAVNLSPGRAMAAQANAIYDSLNSKYKVNTPDNDVAKEERLSEIHQKYGKGVGGSADVIKSLEKYQGQSHVGTNVNLTGYSKTDFTQSYKDTYNQATTGGNGVGNLTLPGVSGNNASMKYAQDGGVKLTRDANGNYVSTPTNAATVNQVGTVVGSEANNAESSFEAKSTYDPHDETNLIDVVKQEISRAQTGGQTSDSVVYRTLMSSYRENKPQNISRDDPVFNGAKTAVDDARYQRGLFEGSCQSITRTTTKDTHYPDWKEARCSSPKKDNFTSCQLERDLHVPVYIEGGDGSMSVCGADCVKIRIGKQGDNYWNGGSCGIFSNALTLKFSAEAVVRQAMITSAEWDDHMEVKLGDTTLLYHVDKQMRDPATYPFPVAGRGCETNTSWYLGDGSGTDKIGGYIDVTNLVRNSVVTDGDRIINLYNRVAVGDGGEGHFEITIKFDNANFRDDHIQKPAGCWDAVQRSDGTCQMDKWVPTDQGTKRLPDSILNLGGPLYPGDTGHLTWKANANGFFCDPLAKNKFCIDDAQTQCFDYEDIKNMPDGCLEQKMNPMCIEKKRDCVPGWFDAGTGACYMEEIVYDCDEGKTVSEIVANTSNTCGELPCIGTDCNAGAPEANKDFGQVAGLLQALSFISADGECNVADPTQCKIFPGEEKYCGWAVGIVGSMTDVDCCKEPDVGPDMMSAAMAGFSLIRSANWQSIATSASEITGSSSFTAIYEGVSSVGTSIGNLTAGAMDAVGNMMTTASNTVMSSLGQEVAVETAKAAGGEIAKETALDGIIAAVEQKVMGTLYNALGKEVIGGVITENAGVYALTPLASTIVSAFSVVMIAYTVYKLTMMIAQMIVSCKPEELETASKIHEKACFKVGDTYCLKEINMGIKKVCVKRAQNYCCYSSMLPRIVMQQAVVQLGLTDCSGITIAQMQQLDWSRIDLTEWVAEATLGGALPDGQDDLTLEALTGNGHVLAGGQDRDNTLERLNNRYESDKLINASKETQDLIQLENVDCSYMPRPAICKFQ